MNNIDLVLAQALINKLKLGDKNCVKEIYGDEWIKITNKNDFGKKFKLAVKEHLLSNIKHLKIRSNGRCDEYEIINTTSDN